MTKAERKAELQALVNRGDVNKLRDIWRLTTPLCPHEIEMFMVGFTADRLMQEILDNEFPGDDSVASDPDSFLMRDLLDPLGGLRKPAETPFLAQRPSPIDFDAIPPEFLYKPTEPKPWERVNSIIPKYTPPPRCPTCERMMTTTKQVPIAGVDPDLHATTTMPCNPFCSQSNLMIISARSMPIRIPPRVWVSSVKRNPQSLHW